MASDKPKQKNVWVIFLILGLTLNTLGIALPAIGWFRYLLMVLGLSVLLFTVLLTLQERQP